MKIMKPLKQTEISSESHLQQVNPKLIKSYLVIPIRVYLFKHLLNLPLVRLFQQLLQLFLCYKPCLILVHILKSLFQCLLCEQLTLLSHRHDKLVEIYLPWIVLIHILNDLTNLYFVKLGVLLLQKVNQLLRLNQTTLIVVNFKKHLSQFVSLLLCHLLETQETLNHRNKVIFSLKSTEIYIILR